MRTVQANSSPAASEGYAAEWLTWEFSNRAAVCTGSCPASKLDHPSLGRPSTSPRCRRLAARDQIRLTPNPTHGGYTRSSSYSRERQVNEAIDAVNVRCLSGTDVRVSFRARGRTARDGPTVAIASGASRPKRKVKAFSETAKRTSVRRASGFVKRVRRAAGSRQA
jgi:hypothetical protein